MTIAIIQQSVENDALFGGIVGVSSMNEDILNDNAESVDLKESIKTADSHNAHKNQEYKQQTEELILNWFSLKGVAIGNP